MFDDFGGEPVNVFYPNSQRKPLLLSDSVRRGCAIKKVFQKIFVEKNDSGKNFAY